MSVESTVRADPPRVNRWGWGGADGALDYQRFVDGLLSRLERGGRYGSKISLGTVNVESLHGCGSLVCNVDDETRAVSLGFAFGF